MVCEKHLEGKDGAENGEEFPPGASGTGSARFFLFFLSPHLDR